MKQLMILIWVALSCASCTRNYAGNGNGFHQESHGIHSASFFNASDENYPTLYLTAFEKDTCVIYQNNIKNGFSSPAIKAAAGQSHFNKKSLATFDPFSGFLFIADPVTRQLWMTMLPGECPLFCCGKLAGSAGCSCFLNGDYYYVNERSNTLNKVNFSSQWMISGEQVIDTIPQRLHPDHMLISPALDFIYISGNHEKYGNTLISYSLCDSLFQPALVRLGKNVRLAFGSDNRLYAFSPSPPYHFTIISP